MIRYLFIFWYCIGLILMLTIGVPTWLSFSNGLFLVFFALYAIHIEGMMGEERRRSWSRIMLVGVLTFAVEWLGVTMGWPFGDYKYTSLLGISLGGVPLAIFCAWIGVIVTVMRMTAFSNRWTRALHTGLWTVVFDLVLDPVAFARQFWIWHEPGDFYGIPAANFISWFVISAAISFLFPLREVSANVRIEAVRLTQMMLFMFGLLGAKEGLMMPFIIALAAIVVAEGAGRIDRIRLKQVV